MRYLRYILGVAVIPAIFLATWIASFYLQLGQPVEAHIHKRYNRLEDKLVVLERLKGAEKIVIVSGSNSMYGLVASEIEAELGIPTVNMAVAYSFGMRYYFNKIKPYLGEGDIVLLPVEYLLLNDQYNDVEFPRDTRLLILREDPEFFSTLSLDEKLRLIFGIHFTSLISGLAYSLPEEARSYHYFSDSDPRWRGDLMASVNHQPGKLRKYKSPVFRFPKKNIHRQRISEFVQWADANDITVIATYPTLVYTDEQIGLPDNREFFEHVRNFWEEIEVTVLGTPRKAMYPKRLHHSQYHLTSRGRSIHTEKVTGYLRDYLGRTRH